MSAVQGNSARRLHVVEPTESSVWLRDLIKTKNDALMQHRYFQLCRTNGISRSGTLELMKQLYCFSVFYERLLAKRIVTHHSKRDDRVLAIARHHLREEVGHPELFREALRANGVSESELETLSPRMFTKALFGYLSATVD